MTYDSFDPPHRTLMGPGPSDVSPRVLDALARPTIGHLDPRFIDLMDETKALLQYAFRTENALTMPVSGPGTAGMESCVVNLVEPGTKAVVCQNGVFGGRLKAMTERAGGEVVLVEDEWGRAVSPEKVEAALKANPDAEVLMFVHAETSTGVLSDAETLAKLGREHGCLVVADTVTSLGGSPLEVDAWGLDAVYSGTQKCLSCIPGLSPVTFSERGHRARAEPDDPGAELVHGPLARRRLLGRGARSGPTTTPRRSTASTASTKRLLMLHEEGLEARVGAAPPDARGAASRARSARAGVRRARGRADAAAQHGPRARRRGRGRRARRACCTSTTSKSVPGSARSRGRCGGSG